MKKILLASAAVLSLFTLTACNDAEVVSQNISTAADNFEVARRVVFFNGITDNYLLQIEGLCSIKADRPDMQLEVTCKTGPKSYIKQFLGLSDNVSYLVEQLEGVDVSAYHYRRVFKPQTILSDWDFKGDAGELTTNRN